MKQNPLFSIIIPTCNRGYVVWKAIQSVQKQIYPNWELLIVDDGSTDNTLQLVAEFQHDPRISYIKTPNKGASHARNTGLKKSNGEVVVYLDSDDVLYENFLSIADQMFRKFPEKIFAIPNYNFRVELYDENHRLVDFAEMEQRQTNNLTLQQIFNWEVKSAFGTGLLHRKETFNAGVIWDESLPFLDDWDYVMQLGTAFPQGFLHIPYVLYEYAQRYGTDGSCSTRTYAEFAEGFEKIYQKHKNDPLMQGQTWYPNRVEKYKKLQEQFEKGEVPAPVYKYFPEYFKKK